MSGKWFNVVSYGLNAQEDIDYEALEARARQHKPKLIIAGASAFALRIDFERIARIAREVDAYFMRIGDRLAAAGVFSQLFRR